MPILLKYPPDRQIVGYLLDGPSALKDSCYRVFIDEFYVSMFGIIRVKNLLENHKTLTAITACACGCQLPTVSAIDVTVGGLVGCGSVVEWLYTRCAAGLLVGAPMDGLMMQELRCKSKIYTTPRLNVHLPEYCIL